MRSRSIGTAFRPSMIGGRQEKEDMRLEMGGMRKEIGDGRQETYETRSIFMQSRGLNPNRHSQGPIMALTFSGA